MHKLFFFFLLLSVFSCKIQQNQQPNSGLTINGVVIPKGESNLTIHKGEIHFEFDVLPYNSKYEIFNAAQFSFTTKESNIQYFNEGIIAENNPFIGPGTGIATEKGKPYPLIYLDYGNHYIFYENNDDKRGDFIKFNEDGSVRLSWTVDTYFFKETRFTRKIENSSIKKLYLMVFLDENLNDIVEQDEYYLINIQLE